MSSSDRAAEQAQFKKTCDGHVETALTRNPTVKFLLDKLVHLGCEPPPALIRCMDCGEKQAGGGFGVVVEETVMMNSVHEKQQQKQQQRSISSNNKNSNSSKPQCQQSLQDLQEQLRAEQDGTTTTLKLLPEIYLCQQHVRNETHAHESIVHELIHAVDMCRTKMDPLHNCVHMACTEIRAENLSGECSAWNELGRITTQGQGFAKHGQACVKRRAALSVKANPNCRERAHEFVDAAFERCYQDTYPFDRHPNLR